jgi:putative colanic acid biosynthesis acetyltransferase WcaF
LHSNEHLVDHYMQNDFQSLTLFKVPIGFRGRSGWFVQLWWIIQAVFFRPSPQILYSWRVFLLRLFGAKIGKGCIIRPSATFTYPWKVTIGDYVWIGDDVVIYNLGEIQIGSNAVVSQRSYLCGGGHDYTKLDFPIFQKPIVIGEECWIATDVFIGAGVTIGKGAVVGARSSVYNDLKGGNVYAGNPAKFIKTR